MRAALLLAWRNLSSRPARTLLSGSGAVLGVALIMAIAICLRSLNTEFQALDAGDAGDAAFVVAPMESGRQLDQNLTQTVQAVAGVDRVLPQVRGNIGLTTGGSLQPVYLFAIEPEGEAALHTYEMVAGRFPSAADEPGVVLEEKWAATQGIKLGDTVKLVFRQAQVEWPVTGLVARKGLGRFNGGGVVLLNLAHHQQQGGGEPGLVHRFLVALKPDADPETTMQAIAASLPADAEISEAGAAALGSDIELLSLGLTFFAGGAAVVGAFLIFGSFALAFRQRTIQTGMAMAVGASKGQVALSLLLEGAGTGLAGSLVGAPLGVALSLGMLGMVSHSANRTIGSWEVGWADWLLSIGIGVGVSVLSVLLPAWRAARTTPLEALKGADEGAGLARNYRSAVIGILMAAVGLLGWRVAFQTGNMIVAQGLSLSYYVGVALAIPLLVRWGVTYLLQPLARRLGPVAMLAAGNLDRHIGRATVTVAAMMISLATLINFTAGIQSFWRGMDNFVESAFGSDVVLTGFVSDQMLTDLRHAPGVERAATDSAVTLRVEGGGRDIAGFAIDPAEHRQVLPFRLDEGDREAAFDALEQGGAIILAKNMAQQQGIRVGDTIRLKQTNARGEVLPDQFVALRVVGLITVNFDGGRLGYISKADADKYFGGAFPVRAYAKAAPGSEVDAMVQDLGQRFPGLVVQNAAAFREALREDMQGDMAAFMVILYLVLGASGLGIVNTLALSVVEQRRELALLRAVGATVGQSRAMVVAEAAFLGFAGAGLGLLASAFFGKSFVSSGAEFMNFIAPFTYPTAEAAVAFVTSILVAVAAALLPAWQAGRVPVVGALRTE